MEKVMGDPESTSLFDKYLILLISIWSGFTFYSCQYILCILCHVRGFYSLLGAWVSKSRQNRGWILAWPLTSYISLGQITSLSFGFFISIMGTVIPTCRWHELWTQCEKLSKCPVQTKCSLGKCSLGVNSEDSGLHWNLALPLICCVALESHWTFLS